MKKSLLSLTIIASMASTFVFAAPDGTVNFTGEIINAPCNIDLENRLQAVDLGSISVANLKSGSSSTERDFALKLTNCKLVDESGSPISPAAVTFAFTPINATKTELIKVNEAANVDKVGIAITDPDNADAAIKNGILLIPLFHYLVHGKIFGMVKKMTA